MLPPYNDSGYPASSRAAAGGACANWVYSSAGRLEYAHSARNAKRVNLHGRGTSMMFMMQPAASSKEGVVKDSANNVHGVVVPDVAKSAGASLLGRVGAVCGYLLGKFHDLIMPTPEQK